MGGKSKSVVVGYKYFLGMHAVLCQSPVDALLEIKFGDRTAWGSRAKDKRISVFRNNLFGGQSREGGVSGFIDVEGGEPDQGQNDYLASRLTGLVPNFRGVVSLVFRQFYFGNNPYIKPWSAKIQNVASTFGNFEKRLAPVNVEITNPNVALYIALDNSLSMQTGTRGATAKTAISQLLNSIPLSNKIAVGFVRWSGTLDHTNFKYNFNESARTSLLTSVDDTVFDRSGTDFDVAFSQASSFFSTADASIPVNASSPLSFVGAATGTGGAGVGASTGNDPLRRVIVFVTDGEPVPESSFDDALATIAGIPRVEVFAFNIETTDTQFTDPLDSSGESVVIFDGNADEMASSIAISISSFADLNAAHIARDMLINPNSDGLGDETLIGDSFATAAQTLFDEGFGLSFLWSNRESKDAFKQQIEAHIDARIYFDRANGKWEIKLIRPDYTVGNLFVFDQSNIIDWVTPPETPKVWELTNQITLEYTRRDTGKTSSVTLTNIAGVQASGRIINEKVSMPGITWPPLANFVAQRELQARGLPITRGALRAAYAPATIAPGDAIVINEPRVGISNMVCRVTEVEEPDGQDNSVLVRFATDVFGLNPSNGSFAVEDVGEAEDLTALPPDITNVLELPYYTLVQNFGDSTITDTLTEDPDAGFWGAGCNDPGPGHVSAQVSEENAGDYVYIANVPFSPAFQLTSTLGRLPTDTTFTANETGREDEVAVGDLLRIDDEFVRVDTIVIANGIATFTVGRGCLDTVPRLHNVGTWAIDWVSSIVSDEIQYTAGESVDVKVAPQTNEDVYPLSSLDPQVLYFDSRALRPYGPGQLKIDNSYDPGLVVGNVTATWVHRDRIQQTSAVIEDHLSAAIGPEDGVSYRAIRRLLTGKTDVFTLIDIFVDEDWFIDFESGVDEIVEVDSPSDGTTHVFDTDDLDFFDIVDVFAQSDWFAGAFTSNTRAMQLGIQAVRGSPEYENWQTPFVTVSPLLSAINLTAEDI